MKIFSSNSGKWRTGFTLVEVLIASSLGVLVSGAVMVLFLETARENYRALADQGVEHAASLLQDRILAHLRSMSARAGLVYRAPVIQEEVAVGYRRVTASRGMPPDFPREELQFDSVGGRMLYFKDASNTNSENATVLLQSKVGSYRLREACFFPSLKIDGTPDNSLVNVILVLDDDGSSRSRPTGNPISVERTFSVRLRND